MQLYQPSITGSLSVSGSINISGSINVVGSGGTITGTASYASNAELLDGLDSTVFTLTSSFAAQTASFTAFTASQNILNGKYATTGSNTFTGVQTVNSNLVVTGSITAQTLVVQTVTSSVVYSSGSNVFGNNIANTQTFTGSMNLTGSLTVVTTGTELQVTSTGVNLGNALTDSHNVTGSLRITGSTLQISSSNYALSLVGGGSTRYAGTINNTSGNLDFGIEGSAGNQLFTGAGSYESGIGTSVAKNFHLVSNSTVRMTVSASGNVGIGTSTAYTKLELYGSAQNYANSGCIVFSDSVGNVNSRRWLVGNVAAGDYGDLTFAVSSTITGDPTNAKMTINKSGSVGIGTSSPSTLLHINTARSSGADVNIMTLSDNVTGVQTSGFGVRILATSNNGQAKSAIAFEADGGTNNDTAIAFYTQTSAASLDRRMTINRGGYILTPYQPAFYAYTTGGTSTATTGNFAGFATTRVNRGSHYSTSTGRFTAPIAGVYRFVFAALYRRLAGAAAGEISISINGTNVNTRGMGYAFNNVTDSHTPVVVELIISLSASDYVMPFIYSVGSGSDWYIGENLGYFCGYLIG